MQLAAKASCQLTLRLLPTRAYRSVPAELLASECPGCASGRSLSIQGSSLSYLPHFTRSLPAVSPRLRSQASKCFDCTSPFVVIHKLISHLRIHVADEELKKSRYTSGLMFYTVFHPSSKITHLGCTKLDTTMLCQPVPKPFLSPLL